MLHEFAVEPSAIRNWDRLQFFLSNFGVHLGRILSRYPKRWERHVVDNLTCPDVEKKRIVEALARARSLLFTRHHEWDDQKLWLDNAEQEHFKRPFHAIIARSNPRSQTFVFLDDVDVSNPPDLWKVAHAAKIQRQARVMANAASKLFAMARTVIFVDRNFSPKDRGFREALTAFLKAMLDRNGKWLATRIEYHTGDRLQPDEFRKLCSAFLPEVVPAGMTIKFVRWAFRDLHNRYILTDYGGLKFGQGLDQGATADSTSIFPWF